MQGAVSAILDAISQAKKPAVLVDCLIQRHNSVKELKELVEKLQLPVYTTTMGKGIVDDTNPLVVGVYNGRVSSPGLSEEFESSDLVLMFGNLPADTNTGGFSRKLEMGTTIDFKPNEVVVSACFNTTTGPCY